MIIFSSIILMSIKINNSYRVEHNRTYWIIKIDEAIFVMHCFL